MLNIYLAVKELCLVGYIIRLDKSQRLKTKIIFKSSILEINVDKFKIVKTFERDFSRCVPKKEVPVDRQ